MSKRKIGGNFTKRTAETQYMTKEGGNIPKRIKEDTEFRFGKSSGAFNPDSQRIGGVINYEYLREHMLESIAQKTLESLNNSKVTKKDWRNKVFNLRSQSVAKQIYERDLATYEENNRLTNTFSKLKQSNASERNMYKFPTRGQ